MINSKKISKVLVYLGIIVVQMIMTQVVTLSFSFIAPNMEKFPQTYPFIFVAILGVTFTIGIMLVGWVAILKGWLDTRPLYMQRLVATLIGAYLPLIIALIVYHPLEPGNPFFFISIMTGILGFYIPGWLRQPD